MNTDFRVAVDFFTHHKARKLKKRLGAAAVLSLLQLWAYAAKLRTDGSLSGMTPEDIELAAEWEGEDGAFAAALEEIGFIDVERPSDGRQTNADGRSTFYDASEIRLHDWADHNQWAADYDDRSDKARFSRLATVNRKAFEKLKAQGVNAISKNDYDILTKVQRPSDGRQTNADVAPTPAPSPAPTHKERKTPPYPPQGGSGESNQVAKPHGRKSSPRDPTGNSLSELRQAVAAYTESEPLRKTLENFRLMRERIRKPMTGPALQLLFRELEKLAMDDDTLKIAIIEQSIMNSWQGVFPLKGPVHAGQAVGQVLNKNMETTAAVLLARQQRRQVHGSAV